MIAARLAKRSLLLAPLLVLAAVAWKFTVAREPNEAAQPSGPEKLVATADLGGEVRMLTYLSTDKPIYRENETVYFRGVLLDHRTRKPLPEGQIAQAVVEIKGPKGETVFSGMTVSEASVLGFPWAIPSGQAGGEYTVKVSYPWHGFAPAEHKFDIRAYRAPRLKNQIEFLRDGYGPGDEVVATLHSERAEGGVPAGASVDVIARVDGVEAFRGQAQIDEAGDCTARFTLPAAIARGEGTLALVIEDGGVVETASKTIPILLQTVDLTMYPEGGQLVAGLPNRVYFEAFTPAQKPVDLAGAIVDSQGEQVAEFRSEHEGRGRFAFTPEAGQKYSMRIDEPAGIAALYPLPEVAEKGAVLSTEQDAFAADEPVNVRVRAAGLDGDLLVTLSKRESVIGRMNVEAVDGSVDKVAKFELAESDADGVLIATVWDSQGNPLAERLVFRQPAKQVRVKISADAEQYVPGGTARLTIETTDESGKPLSAVVGLAVTDDSVLEMIEKREQAPRLPVMVLLEGDVRELADAHVYLDAENDEAPRQVDLLLGTQGWRRFAFINTEAFVQEHGDDARRVLALQVVTMREWSRSAGMFGGGIGGGIAVDGFAAPGDPVAANESAPAAQLAASNLKSAPEEAAEAPQSAAALAPAAEQPARDQSALDKTVRRHPTWRMNPSMPKRPNDNKRSVNHRQPGSPTVSCGLAPEASRKSWTWRPIASWLCSRETRRRRLLKC
ncbi:MAG: MG2 domain-containing protein [Pirellulaceae bacterium]